MNEPGEVFVDTNVLVYARDVADAQKQASAAEWMAYLWRSGRGRLSMQVLGEYYVTVTRKLDPGMDRESARRDVDHLMAWEPIVVAPAVLRRAWQAQDRYALSFWDALIVAAAQAARCALLLTEDLQAGQELDGVRVVDPFALRPPDAAPR